jgi:hypothetical protein
MKILDAIYMQLPAIPRRPKSHNGYYLSRSFWISRTTDSRSS